MKSWKPVLAVFAWILLLSLPAAAGQPVMNGVDLWATPGDGTTFYNFQADPLPAGFFCPGSTAFAGRVSFKGLPIATSVPGVLGTTAEEL